MTHGDNGFGAAAATAWALAGACWLAGCANVTTEVEPAASFPSPLAEVTELTVGLGLSEAQRAYAHASTEDRHYHWRLKIGAAQAALFESALSGLFAEVVAAGGEPPRCARCDVIVAPELQEVQLATPQRSPSQAYEVWLRYRIALLSPDGAETLGRASISAYGKAPERLGRERGMRAALERALRDAGAMLTVRWIRSADIARHLRPAK